MNNSWSQFGQNGPRTQVVRLISAKFLVLYWREDFSCVFVNVHGWGHRPRLMTPVIIFFSFVICGHFHSVWMYLASSCGMRRPVWAVPCFWLVIVEPVTTLPWHSEQPQPTLQSHWPLTVCLTPYACKWRESVHSIGESLSLFYVSLLHCCDIRILIIIITLTIVCAMLL